MQKTKIIPGNIYHINKDESFADVYALTGEEEPIEELHGPNAKPYFLALPVSTMPEYAGMEDVVCAKPNDILGLPFMIMTSMTHEIPCSDAIFTTEIPDELDNQVVNTHLYAMGCEYDRELLDKTPRGSQVDEDTAEWEDKELYHKAIADNIFNLFKILEEIKGEL